jgi:hypothetical protein
MQSAAAAASEMKPAQPHQLPRLLRLHFLLMGTTQAFQLSAEVLNPHAIAHAFNCGR